MPHTSTTAAARSSLFRRIHTIRPNHAARSHRPTAHSRNPVVPHHLSLSSTRSKPDVSKLAPSAHQPHTNREKGMVTAVATRTGRTVLRRRRRNNGGTIKGGKRSMRRRGRRGTTEGVVRGEPSGGGCVGSDLTSLYRRGQLTSVVPQTQQRPTMTPVKLVSQRAKKPESDPVEHKP